LVSRFEGQLGNNSFVRSKLRYEVDPLKQRRILMLTNAIVNIGVKAVIQRKY